MSAGFVPVPNTITLVMRYEPHFSRELARARSMQQLKQLQAGRVDRREPGGAQTDLALAAKPCMSIAPAGLPIADVAAEHAAPANDALAYAASSGGRQGRLPNDRRARGHNAPLLTGQ